jgi:uncharacterized protein
MRQAIRLMAVAALLAAVGGFVAYEWNAASPPAAAGLRTQPIWIDTGTTRHPFTVEVAERDRDLKIGLMYRRALADDAGMLFVYTTTHEISMWMDNTYIALDMLFLAPDGTITHIATDTEPMSRAEVRSEGPARAVLEVNAGTAARLGLKTGDRVIASELPGK